MVYTVYYRGKDGRRQEDVFDAESRIALFASLSSQNITPIQIVEGIRSKSKKRPHGSGALFKIVASLIALATIVFVALLFIDIKNHHERAVAGTKKASSGMIKEAMPELPQEIARDNENDEVSQPGRLLSLNRDTDSVLTKTVGNTLVNKDNSSTFGTVYPNNKRQPPRKLFKHYSENYIAGLLRARPGMTVIGTALPKQFDEDYIAAMSEEIQIEPEDTPEEIEIKEMMKSIRVDAKKIIAEGGSIMEAILEERKYLQKVGEIRHTLQQEVSKMRKAGASEEELLETVEAANRMMDEYDGMHIKLSPFRNRTSNNSER